MAYREGSSYITDPFTGELILNLKPYNKQDALTKGGNKMFDPYGMYAIGTPLSQGAGISGLADAVVPTDEPGMMAKISKFMGGPIAGGIGKAAGGLMQYDAAKKQREMQKKQLEEQKKQRIAQQQQQNIMAMLAIARYADTLQPGRGGR